MGNKNLSPFPFMFKLGFLGLVTEDGGIFLNNCDLSQKSDNYFHGFISGHLFVFIGLNKSIFLFAMPWCFCYYCSIL